MVYEYRVTKYDPSKRDKWDVYTSDEWMMFSQVGSVVGGKKLTIEEYQRTEDAYVVTAVSFLRESGTQTVTVRNLEDPHGEAGKSNVHEGTKLDLKQIASLIRLILRNLAWCRLESSNSFVRFGWDYYMYIGVPIPCVESRAFARDHGLFVEDRPSPHRDSPADKDDRCK